MPSYNEWLEDSRKQTLGCERCRVLIMEWWRTMDDVITIGQLRGNLLRHHLDSHV